jgi:hypothetical protein
VCDRSAIEFDISRRKWLSKLHAARGDGTALASTARRNEALALAGPFAQQGQGAMPMVTDTPAAFDSGRGFAHSHLAATPTSVSLTTSTWRQVAAIPEDVETPVSVVGSQSSSARGVSHVDSARGGGVARTDSARVGGVHTDSTRAPASPLSPRRALGRASLPAATIMAASPPTSPESPQSVPRHSLSVPCGPTASCRSHGSYAAMHPLTLQASAILAETLPSISPRYSPGRGLQRAGSSRVQEIEGLSPASARTSVV